MTDTHETQDLVPVGGMQLMQPATTDIMSAATIDTQISTAKAYPRSVTESIDNSVGLATRTKEMAEMCQYKLPKGGGQKGPSVRLAEIMVSCWGNIRSFSKVVEVTEDEIVAVAYVHDLERNVVHSEDCRRNIRYSATHKTKAGQRYGLDMINTTGSVARAIAFRNCVFKVIPRAFVETVYQASITCVLGGAKTVEERRVKALEHLSGKGIDQEAVLKHLGRARVGDITNSDIQDLLGIVQASKDGEVDLQELFNPAPEPEGPADLSEVAKKGRAKKKADVEAADVAKANAEAAAKDEAEHSTGKPS